MYSRRVLNIRPSATLAFSIRAKVLRDQGRSIINFAVGEPDFDTPKHIRDAAAEALSHGRTHYTDPRGIIELREAVAEKCKKDNGISCSTEDVLVTPTKHAIFMSIMALINYGEEVLIPSPGWVSYMPATRFARGKGVWYPCLDQKEIVAGVQERITDKTRLLILNSPSNPTGMVMSKTVLKGLADLAKDHDLWVLSDEIYEKILFSGKHHSIATLDGMAERTLTANGFSKAYAMTGWRIGYLVGPHEAIQHIDKIQAHTVTCATSFAQYGALAALNGTKTPMEKMIEEFKGRRDMLYDMIKKSPYLECRKPEGAFYMFPKYKNDMGSIDLATHILENAGVAMTPGLAFGPDGEGHLRISYATSRKNIKKGMTAIEDALEKL